MPQLIIFVLFIAVFWVMIIRPQQQQRRNHQQAVAALEAGQRVMTVGGLIGTLVQVNEETVVIDTGDGTELTFGRTFIRQQILEDVPAVDEPIAVDDIDDLDAGDERSAGAA